MKGASVTSGWLLQLALNSVQMSGTEGNGDAWISECTFCTARHTMCRRLIFSVVPKTSFAVSSP